MSAAAQTIRKSFTFIACAGLALIFALMYMKVMAMGWKMILAFHAGLIFAFIAVIFVQDLASFLIFALFATLSAGMDFHVVYEPILGVQTGPFAEGVGVDLADFILLGLAAGWLIKLGIRRKRSELRFDATISSLWLAWLGWLLIVAIVWADHSRYAIYEIISLFKGYILFLFILNFPAGIKTLKMMVYGFFTAATIHALYAIFQFITRSYFTVAGNDPRYLAPEGFRSIGWLGSPDGTAILIVTVIPMMLGYFFNERNRPAKMIVGLALIICVTGILVTKVRIAGLSLMISMFVVFIIGLVRGWIGYGSTIRAAFAGLLVMAMLSPFIIQRFEKGSWGEARIPLMVTASNMIEKHWATGVGSSNYLFHIESNLPMKLRGSWEAIVHNEYMLRLAETGVIGFTLYYALLLAICWRLWRLTKRTGNQWISFVSAGLLAAIAGSLAHRMTSIYHLSAIYTQYCAFFGMAGFMWFLDEQN